MAKRKGPRFSSRPCELEVIPVVEEEEVKTLLPLHVGGYRSGPSHPR